MLPSPANASKPRVAIALIVFASLGLWLFRDALLHGRVLFERDVHVVWYSQVEVFVHTVLSGAWPLWDPSTSFGQPMLANPNVQVLYPPTWLNLLIRPWTFYWLYALAHLVFGGAGVFALLRRLGVSRAGAMLAGAVWMLSGPVLSLVNVWHHLAGAAWMPWVLLAAECAINTQRPRDALLWGGAAGLQILAGSPDACIETVLLQVAWIAPRLEYRRPGGETNRRVIGIALLALLFAAWLSAGQWMPSLEAARGSARSDLPAVERTAWSYPPVALPGLVLPVIPVGLPLAQTQHLSMRELRWPFLRSAYLGLLAFALVLAGVARRGPARKLALIGGVMLLVALGRHAHVYDIAATLIPPLKTLRFPEKFLVVVTLCWASLTGIGFDYWRERRRLPGPAVWILSLLIGFAAAGALALWLAPDRVGRAVLEAGVPALPTLRPVAARLARSAACGLALLALMAWTRRRTPGGLAACACALLVAGELAITHDGLNPMGARDVFTVRPPVVDALVRDGARRLYVWDYFTLGSPPGVSWGFLSQQAYLRPPLAGRWGFTGSFDRDALGLYPRRLSALIETFHSLRDPAARLRLLQVGGVDHVIALQGQMLPDLTPVAQVDGFLPVKIDVFRVPDALPRSYVVGAARSADDPDALRLLVDPAFDPRQEIILPRGAITAAGTAPISGSVKIVDARADRLRLVSETNSPGWVVVLDTFDAGWEARVDGRGVPVQRANLVFRAVAVTAGRHEIELSYRPTSALVGLGLTATAIFVGLAALFATKRRPATTSALSSEPRSAML